MLWSALISAKCRLFKRFDCSSTGHFFGENNTENPLIGVLLVHVENKLHHDVRHGRIAPE